MSWPYGAAGGSFPEEPVFSLGPDWRVWLASLCVSSLSFSPVPLPHPEAPRPPPNAVSAATSLPVPLASPWFADVVSGSHVQNWSVSGGQVLSGPTRAGARLWFIPAMPGARPHTCLENE